MLAESCCALILCLVVLVYWLKRSLSAQLIGGIRVLVEKMKEYDLDTRAGLIVFRGRNLKVVYLDPILAPVLGNPQCIEELLPESMHRQHRMLIRPYTGWFGNPLPKLLNHPLRNVPILKIDKSILKAKLIIGKFKIGIRDIYYVVVQPNQSAAQYVH